MNSLPLAHFTPYTYAGTAAGTGTSNNAGPSRLLDTYGHTRVRAYLRSGRTAVLLVPSSPIPHEMNVLLNPSHPDFAKIHIRQAEPFSFDPRMWK